MQCTACNTRICACYASCPSQQQMRLMRIRPVLLPHDVTVVQAIICYTACAKQRLSFRS